jgi:hypothetical protein
LRVMIVDDEQPSLDEKLTLLRGKLERRQAIDN